MEGMIGNNSLRLCYAEMVVALQKYLDYRMPDAKVKVTAVSQDASEDGFVICFVDREKNVR